MGGRNLAAAGVLAALTLAPAAAADTPFQAGAARVDVTPPAVDPSAFPTCPSAVFTGPRQFAFEEPYVDSNGNGRFDYPEAFCDANLNGRYDGIYSSGGVDHLATGVHDPIDARAVALSEEGKTAVIVSVVAQGIHETYTHRMRARAKQLRPGIDELIVSANHNESSPDTVGIYGGPDVGGAAGGRSGIDDYYMDFLVEQVAQAAAKAYDARKPASLWAKQFPIPAGLRVRLSHNFPTTDDQRNPAAIDPKVGVLQARDAAGKPIFTTMSLAAHNQEIGHSDGPASLQLSSDWPGYFHKALEQQVPGMAMFLVGDNGSEEDPETVPPPPADPDPHKQAKATGDAFAATVRAQAPQALELRGGSLVADRHEFFVPLENNLFRAAAQAGLFGDRQTFLAGQPAGTLGPDLRTEVAVVDVGPDLQFAANPGEAFPALALGGPWGIEDAGCPSRANPPVPTWHARARFRFQVGLADDMVGYLIPAWANSSQPAVFTTTCVNDSDDKDPKGHQHKLETEGVGPAASNAVAAELTKLLDRRPDPAASIVRGRFLRPDGTLSRRAAGAVGAWLADGTIVALPGRRSFGTRRVDRTGAFMDYDGAEQPGPDVTTRGMLVRGCGGGVAGRYYLDVYPSLAGPALGAAVSGNGPGGLPCRARGSTAASRPRCLPRSLRVRRTGVGPLRIGDSRARVLGRAGKPARSRRRALRYCVKGGGRALVAFSRGGRVRVIATTARRHGARGVHRGSSSGAFLRRFPAAARLRGSLFGTGGRGFVRLRGGRVRMLGVAAGGLSRRPRVLARYLRLLGI